MGDKSGIEWTDATWNPIAGCTPVSPGCLNCYAATMAARLEAMGQAKYRGLTVLNNGRRVFNGKINLDEEALDIPLRWTRPRRIFVNSMSDLFHEDVPFGFVDRVFAVMALAPQHTFQVLTKRPERMAEYMSEFYPEGGRLERIMGLGQTSTKFPYDFMTDEMCKVLSEIDVLPNVWLGTSVENQPMADKRIFELLKCPAAVHFLSIEPLLGPIDLGGSNALPVYREAAIVTERMMPAGDVHSRPGRGWCRHDGNMQPWMDWVIVGGESGPRSRECDISWIRAIINQCKAAGTAVFVKQLGARPISPVYCGIECQCGLHFGFQNRKGGDWEEWPADLRVREFPK